MTDFETKTILLIEDNEEIRESITEILEFENYSVITAENGIAGFEKIQTKKTDLIICDIMMPGMNGIEVFQKTRAIEAIKNIPFVFISSLNRQREITFMKGIGLDPDDFLEKPFTRLQLLNCVKSNLNPRIR